MNLITSKIYQQNVTTLMNWVDSTPVNQMIDTVTYDLYESSNPFRTTFGKESIENKNIRSVVNTATAAGAEAFSFFTNPFYLTHKVTQIPVLFNSVVDTYKQIQKSNTSL